MILPGPRPRGFVMPPARVHAQHPAGLAEAQACGGSARNLAGKAGTGACDDDG